MKNLAKGGALTAVCFIIAIILAIYVIVKDMSSARMIDMHKRTAEGIEYIGDSFKQDVEKDNSEY